MPASAAMSPCSGMLCLTQGHSPPPSRAALIIPSRVLHLSSPCHPCLDYRSHTAHQPTAPLQPHNLLRRYQEEVQQGSFLFPGSFGTGSRGSRLPTFVPKNAANTNIVPWRGGLLAMFESGQPHHLQAQSLHTQGLDLLAGALKAGVPLQTPFSGVDAALGAMPHHTMPGMVWQGCVHQAALLHGGLH